LAKCKHCQGELARRNPTGKCDHLNYPEHCDYCTKNRFTWKAEQLVTQYAKRNDWTDTEDLGKLTAFADWLLQRLAPNEQLNLDFLGE
jgi:hypothetical protein